MKKTLILLVILSLNLTLVGCQNVRSIVTYSVYPVGYLIEKIAGDRIEAVSIQENELVQVANIRDDYAELLKDSLYFFQPLYRRRGIKIRRSFNSFLKKSIYCCSSVAKKTRSISHWLILSLTMSTIS